MSFPAALQSAIFYVVACTPCTKVRHEHKVKDRAKKERAEKARIEAEQPNLYKHPAPYNTNPYWQEEISLGPSLPKKAISKNSSQRGLTSSGKDSTAPSFSEHTNVGDSRTHIGDSSTAIPEDDAISEDWNRRRGYQREDEELWGQWSGHKIMDAFSKARDSAGRLIESTLGIEKEVTEEERRQFYFSPKNPPVNEYHPPVVSSKIPHRDAHRWMKQPPPSAKIMEGKVPVSRNLSSGSKSSAKTLVGEEVQLGRLVQEKLVMEKLRKEHMNQINRTETELIESLFQTRSNRSLSITRSRSLSFEASDDATENPFEKRRQSRLRPVVAPPGYDSSDTDSDSDAGPGLSPYAAHRSHSRRAAQRPKLDTIVSTGSLKNSRVSSKQSKRQKSARRIKTAGSPVGDDTD